MEYAPITVTETLTFQRKAERLLDKDEKAALIGYLFIHPSAGVLIKAAGGIRKLRWARGGQGKRGGVRVVYYFHNCSWPLYLLTLFTKNEKTDIGARERNELATFVKELVKDWE